MWVKSPITYEKNKWANICLYPICYVQFQYKSFACTKAGEKKPSSTLHSIKSRNLKLRICLNTTYFAETEKLLLKIL